MKRPLLSLTLAMLCLGAFSQIKLGVHGGLVMSKAAIETSLTPITSQYKPGPMGGLILGLELGDSPFGILTEFNLINKGMKFSSSAEFLGQQTATSGSAYVYYLELPIQFLYYTDLGNGHFFFGAGPYGASALRGKTKTKFDLNGTSAVEDKDTQFGSGYNQMKRYDYGVNGMIGYKLGYGSYLKVFYSHGLANLSNITETKYYNRCAGVCFGYFFGSGR